MQGSRLLIRLRSGSVQNTRIHVSVCGCLCPELWLWYGTGITLDPDVQTESVSGSAPSGKTGSYKINGSGFASLFVPVFVLCCLWVWYSRTLYLTWIRVFFYNCIRIRPKYPDTQLCLYLSLFGAVVMVWDMYSFRSGVFRLNLDPDFFYIPGSGSVQNTQLRILVSVCICLCMELWLWYSRTLYLTGINSLYADTTTGGYML